MSSAYKIVEEFEKSVALYAGSKYAVAVDSCTNALFLSCVYVGVKEVILPKRTYVSVPGSVIHAGGKVKFEDVTWQGLYQLKPYPIYDGACQFRRDMYIPGSCHCLSFSATKPINIGKGGMILTDNETAVKWFKQARYMGRHEVPLMKDYFEILGWNMYLTPEQAARGLLLMNNAKFAYPDIVSEYPDLSDCTIYELC